MSGNGTSGNGTSDPSRGKRTLIEEGTELQGTMVSSCPLVVMGKVEGDISGPSVEIAATGVVAGKVQVDELRSEGELAGTVEARTVHLSGRVRDQTVIRAQTLDVQLTRSGGAMEVVFGICELAIGEAPSKADAIAAALAPAEAAVAEAAVAETPADEAPAAEAPAAAAAGEEADWDLAEPATAASDEPAPERSGKRGRGGSRRTQPPPPA
jgi:cytoskeletal protein CcmA (bactofilin family)